MFSIGPYYLLNRVLSGGIEEGGRGTTNQLLLCNQTDLMSICTDCGV